MTELIVQLIPLVIGIVMSPLAIMALVAILVSKMARANGIVFLIGWVVGVVGVVLFGLWLFSVLGLMAASLLAALLPVIKLARMQPNSLIKIFADER